MPDFEIEGSPGNIRAKAVLMEQKGQLFYDTGDALAKIDVSGWTGRAADEFREAHDLEPERWIKAGNGFKRAAAGLTTYAGELESAQSRAEWSRKEYERGQQESESARAQYGSYMDRMRSYWSSGGTDQAQPFVDWGDPIQQEALQELAAARADLDDAAHVCAGQVRAGCADAPEEPNWLESGLKFVGGILEGAGEAVWDLLTMVPFSPVNMVIDSYKLATGDLTPEELMKKYELSAESAWDMAQGIYTGLTTDPVGFGKELGKSLLDWDTWADDPARAIGHLVPDAVVAVATGGTGALATRGVKGGLDALDALGDMGKLRHLDDLGDLADLRHLDDLGDGSRLYSMMDDVPHRATYAPEQLGRSQVTDDLLSSHGLTRDEAIDLINKPVSQLTPDEWRTMRALQGDIARPDASTVMQKVVAPEVADRYLMGRDPGFDATEVRGSVTRADDTSQLTTPAQIHDGLRLDYDNTPFRPDDDSTHLIRFTTDDPRFESPLRSEMGQTTHGSYDGWSDPFTGNGFTKAGDDIIPEYQSYPDAAGNAGVPMRDGAEMWEVLPDGSQRLTAVLRDGEWVPQGN